MIESVQVADPVAEAPGAEPEGKSKGTARLISLDAFRGLVMVLMALDHTRDFLSYARSSPEDVAHTTAALFFTRP